MVEISREEAIWRWHTSVLAVECPGISMGRCQDECAFEHYLRFRRAIEAASAHADALLVHDFKAKPRSLRSLMKHGQVTGAGTAEARFEAKGGSLPAQVPGAVALELLELFSDVPPAKLGCRPVEKAAELLKVSRRALEDLVKRSKAARRLRLVVLLKAPFPMEYAPRKMAALIEAEAHDKEADAALVQSIMSADLRTLTPRKLAMRRAILRKDDRIEQLTREKEELEGCAKDERDSLMLKLKAESRELNHLRNYVSDLQAESKSALSAKLREAKRTLERQEQQAQVVQMHAQALAGRLQAARDEQATDIITKRREAARVKALLQEAEAKVAAAHAQQVAAEQRTAAAIESEQRSAAAAREARATAKRKHSEWLAAQEADAIAQAASGKCDEHLEFLAGCVMATVKQGEEKRFKQANASHRGPGTSTLRLSHAKKTFTELGKSQKAVRSKELSGAMVAVAGGEEHVVELMLHHKKANPSLYKQLGLKERITLTAEQMCSICVRMTGSMGKALNRTLKEAGIDVTSNAAVQRALRCSDHSHETAKLSRPNTNLKTKKRFPLIHGGRIVVTDVGKVLQVTTDRHEESNNLSWPPNIPSGEIWICFLSDKGGGSDKLIAKFLCCENMDSVSHVVLLGLCDGIGDDYFAKQLAFGSVYKQIDLLRSTRFTIHAPWHPRLPKRISLNADGYPIWKPIDPAPAKKGDVVQARLSITSIGLTREKYIHLQLRPRAFASTPKTGVSIFGKQKQKPPTPPAMLESLSEKDEAEGEMDEAEGEQSEGAASRRTHRRTRFWRFPPKQQRLSHCMRPGPGVVKPRIDKPTPFRLKGCTFSADCIECNDEPDGELHAVRRQVASACVKGRAPRLARFFHGGDLLSIMHPMGLQGPTSTEFCHGCHARLNQTNAAGVGASRDLLDGIPDERPQDVRDPPRRLGTQAIRRSCIELHAKRKEHSEGKCKKPSDAAFGGCVNMPLFHMNDTAAESSFVTLHCMLGQGLKLFNELEAVCKSNDAEISEFKGLVPVEEIQRKETMQHITKLKKLDAQLEEAMEEEVTHATGIELIQGTPDSAEAIKRGSKDAIAGQEPLPLENEYREHSKELEAVRKKIRPLRKSIEDERKAVAEMRAQDPGPYELELLKVMETLSLKREAYHGGAFVGDDVKNVFEPSTMKRFCAILAKPVVATKLQVGATGRVQLELMGMGSSAQQKEYEELTLSFSDAMTLFTRSEPLCEHLIVDLKKRTDRYAHAYASTLSCQPQPKTHMVCAEIPQQAERMGGPGMLNESAAESEHVRDNMLKRRFASCKEVCENMRLRAQANDRLGDTRIANMLSVEERAATSKRHKRNHASRTTRNKHRT